MHTMMLRRRCHIIILHRAGVIVIVSIKFCQALRQFHPPVLIAVAATKQCSKKLLKQPPGSDRSLRRLTTKKLCD